MSQPTPAEAVELLEALIWHAMAEHAAIADRGFDTAKRREKLHREIDAMYDEREILLLEAQVSA